MNSSQRLQFNKPSPASPMLKDTIDKREPAVLATTTAAKNVAINSLEASITRATAALLTAQKEDGHWVFEVESSATTIAEYVLLIHYLGEAINKDLEWKIGQYIRRIQSPEGGWPLSTNGKIDVSTSVKAYFALKLIGDSSDEEHMIKASKAILAAGGAEASNGFTRIMLALFGIVSWNAVPLTPVEIMLLPEWFPFHLSKISWWSRTYLVPLLVISAIRPLARNPRGVRIDELFRCSPWTVKLPAHSPHQSKGWFWFFSTVDSVLRIMDQFAPQILRQNAINAAVAFVEKRLNGEHGLGAIFPAMVNAVIMYDALGYPAYHPNRLIARQAVENMLVIHDEEAHAQISRSPVWDTSFAVHALLETEDPQAISAARRGLEWLRPLQVLDVRGDWIARRPKVRPGGWAFQYTNPYYPDIDDTVVVVMAMHRADCLDVSDSYGESIARAREWVLGMQSNDGGWAGSEPDNTHYYLNNIPFSDHGAILDPPTSDVTGRCLSMLAQLNKFESKQSCHARDYLLRNQNSHGSWFGRWGVNYIHGTWAVLSALNAIGLPHEDLRIRRAVEWLISIQNPDGGWGEDVSSYNLDYTGHEPAPSTSSQTSWALLGLMAAGEVNHTAVARGVAWLQETQRDHGSWDETRYTGTGFPRVLYLRYHGYCKYFPLWALARYRNMKRDGSTRVIIGM